MFKYSEANKLENIKNGEYVYIDSYLPFYIEDDKKVSITSAYSGFHEKKPEDDRFLVVYKENDEFHIFGKLKNPTDRWRSRSNFYTQFDSQRGKIICSDDWANCSLSNEQFDKKFSEVILGEVKEKNENQDKKSSTDVAVITQDNSAQAIKEENNLMYEPISNNMALNMLRDGQYGFIPIYRPDVNKETKEAIVRLSSIVFTPTPDVMHIDLDIIVYKENGKFNFFSKNINIASQNLIDFDLLPTDDFILKKEQEHVALDLNSLYVDDEKFEALMSKLNNKKQDVAKPNDVKIEQTIDSTSKVEEKVEVVKFKSVTSDKSIHELENGEFGTIYKGLFDISANKDLIKLRGAYSTRCVSGINFTNWSDRIDRVYVYKLNDQLRFFCKQIDDNFDRVDSGVNIENLRDISPEKAIRLKPSDILVSDEEFNEIMLTLQNKNNIAINTIVDNKEKKENQMSNLKQISGVKIISKLDKNEYGYIANDELYYLNDKGIIYFDNQIVGSKGKFSKIKGEKDDDVFMDKYDVARIWKDEEGKVHIETKNTKDMVYANNSPICEFDPEDFEHEDLDQAHFFSYVKFEDMEELEYKNDFNPNSLTINGCKPANVDYYFSNEEDLQNGEYTFIYNPTIYQDGSASICADEGSVRMISPSKFKSLETLMEGYQKGDNFLLFKQNNKFILQSSQDFPKNKKERQAFRCHFESQFAKEEHQEEDDFIFISEVRYPSGSVLGSKNTEATPFALIKLEPVEVVVNVQKNVLKEVDVSSSDKDQEKPTNVPTQTKTSLSSIKDAFIQQLKSDAEKAFYLGAANKLNSVVSTSLVKVMQKQGMSESSITEFMATDIGKSVISFCLGVGLPHIPSLGASPKVMILAENLRVQGIAKAGEKLFDVVSSELIETIVGTVSTLDSEAVSSVEKSINAVSADQKQSQVRVKAPELTERKSSPIFDEEITQPMQAMISR